MALQAGTGGSPVRVAIAGAGIGGLSLALCLHQRGIAAQLFEARPEIRPLGVGINVMPHATAILHDLGLREALDEIAIRTRAVEYRTRFGHLIHSDPRNVEAGFATPQYSIHRGEFQLLLLDAVRARLGEGAVQTDRAVEGFEQTDEAVTIRFRDGTTQDCDVLIGADGLWSKVRKQLHPDEGPPHYEGTMMWRGALEMDQVGDGRTMMIAGNHDAKFVAYPIGERLRNEGRTLLNWVAELRHDRPRHLRDADWTRESNRDFIDGFRGFHIPGLDLIDILTATETVTEFPMVDRDPVSFWTRGRVTLLGDAAHPMYPIGANGASQAILDARLLADLLAERPAHEALSAYEAVRLPATRQIVLANRGSGPERVLDIADARVTGPDDRIEDLIRPEELEAVAAEYRTVAGFLKQEEIGS